MKIKLGIFFGGKSAEHDVSIVSAKAIVKNIDRENYGITLFYISRQGFIYLVNENDFNENNFIKNHKLSFLSWENLISIKDKIDIYFPVLHGPYGEDGKIQALFEMAGVPFVGADSFSSALAMDKVVSKILFERKGLKTVDFLYFTDNNSEHIKELVEKKLGYPIFVKPASLGSSVGITKVYNEEKLDRSVNLAFKYDKKIIIEKSHNVREIEIAVMGNEELIVSKPGEVIPFKDFYDYEDKYELGKTKFNIPVKLDSNLEKKVRTIARKGFRALGLRGFSRVDLFIDKDTNEVYINEINTIPGFTEISMFPKLMALEGYDFSLLISKLIELGFEANK